jgi:hypothetical protein
LSAAAQHKNAYSTGSLPTWNIGHSIITAPV